MKSLVMMVILATVTAGSFSTANAAGDPQPVRDTVFFCQQNYNNASSARHTCNGETFTKVDENNCRVSASCETNTANEFKSTSIVVDANNAGNLSNCNRDYVEGACQNCIDKKTMQTVAC